MSRVTALACTVLLHLALADPKLSPTLEPKSSKKHLKDYSADHAAPVVDAFWHDFDHPYPAVQDHEDFDRDFVKDENSDGGKWNAQMDYDLLRAKMANANKGLQELEKKRDAEARDVDIAKNKLQGAIDEEKAAEARRKAAEQEAEAAQKKVDEAAAAAQGASDKVEKKMKNCEQLKKKLEEAKENLRRLLDKQEELKKKATEAAAKEAYNKRQQDAKAREDAKEAMKRATAARKEEERQEIERMREKGQLEGAFETKKKQVNADLDKLEAEKQAFEEKIAIQKEAYGEASLEYKKQQEALYKLQQEFKKAAEELRVFRRPPHVDNNGGVYNVPDNDRTQRSGAPMRSVAAVVALLIGAAAMC